MDSTRTQPFMLRDYAKNFYDFSLPSSGTLLPSLILKLCILFSEKLKTCGEYKKEKFFKNIHSFYCVLCLLCFVYTKEKVFNFQLRFLFKNTSKEMVYSLESMHKIESGFSFHFFVLKEIAVNATTL